MLVLFNGLMILRSFEGLFDEWHDGWSGSSVHNIRCSDILHEIISMDVKCLSNTRADM